MERPAKPQSPEVIDLLTIDKGGTYVLIMIETKEWDGSVERMHALQNRLNSYLSFILDGQLKRMYPESVGKKVRIQLDCDAGPDSETLGFLDRAKTRLQEFGVEFTINVLP